jgi:pyruvate dehydrogenase E2 component (dihydrolipoamide acetyltransferase)
MPEVYMPRLSDTMEEGAVSRWLKAVGDRVEKGDTLAEIDTDKATMELEAYDAGVLTRLLVEEGVSVAIGQPIAVIGEGRDETADVAQLTAVEQVPGSTPAAPPGRVLSSPIARNLARSHGLDLDSIRGTGPGGRIVRADVEAAVAALPEAAQPPTAAPPAVASPPTAPLPLAAQPAVAPPPTTPAAPTTPAVPTTPAGPTTPAVPTAVLGADDEVIALTNVRRITARRLVESMQSAPHFYLTAVVDADALLAFRADVNARLAATGMKISVNDLVVKACATALRSHPAVNASWAGDRLLRHRRINVGVAVALPDGLIVPVIRDADRKPVSEIAAESRSLAGKARAGRLTPDEFTGGTFTVSNLGMFGVDHFTAVINPPEAAILAVGAAKAEPVVRDGAVVPGTTIKVTLSIDHRVLDGATAAAFLATLTATLTEPLRIVV